MADSIRVRCAICGTVAAAPNGPGGDLVFCPGCGNLMFVLVHRGWRLNAVLERERRLRRNRERIIVALVMLVILAAWSLNIWVPKE